MTKRAAIAAFLCAAFTEVCPACRGPSEAGFCHGCAAELRPISRPCGICGLPSPVRRCPREAAAWHVERMIAPLEYCFPLDHYLQALKFGHGRMLGRALGLLLAEPVAAALADGGLAADTLVPVPLHRERLLRRGYNQAVEIAQALAAELGLRIELAAVSRVRPAPAQSRLGARARRANVAHAFRALRPLPGRRIAVVDDVITTGSTVNALAAVLRAAGAVRVEAIAVARTVPGTAHAGGGRRGGPRDAAGAARQDAGGVPARTNT
ncbi:MAG TPA: ComF family protein [Gammaproteobacteria bacterium]